MPGRRAALTAGLETGAIDCGYLFALTTLGRLQSSDSVKVFQGAPYQPNSMAIMATQGVRSPIPRSGRP
ncbi:MAG: hypothetical protein U0R76_03225 [Candidatus Nanopelagicales bacterium]